MSDPISISLTGRGAALSPGLRTPPVSGVVQADPEGYRLDTTTGDIDAIIDLAAEPVEPGQGRRLYCRACRNSITEEGQRISIDGNHVYARSNPAGIRFCFGCFALAPGCTASGPASEQHSWFQGCRWQIAVCRGCGEHLGWRFRGSHAFFALILGRLVTDEHRGH